MEDFPSIRPSGPPQEDRPAHIVAPRTRRDEHGHSPFGGRVNPPPRARSYVALSFLVQRAVPFATSHSSERGGSRQDPSPFFLRIEGTRPDRHDDVSAFTVSVNAFGKRTRFPIPVRHAN